MKTNLLIFLSLFATILTSQELLFQKEIDVNFTLTIDGVVLPVYDVKTEQLTILTLDNKDISGIQLNQDFEVIGKIKDARHIDLKAVLLGSGTSKGKCHMYFINFLQTHIISKNIDFSNNTIKETNIPLGDKKEKYLESFMVNNDFYVLTIRKHSSIINVYRFTKATEAEKMTFDFSDVNFNQSNYRDLYGTLLRLKDSNSDQEESNDFTKFSIEKVDPANPTPIGLSAVRNKLYIDEEEIFITIDKDKAKTRVLKMNLKDGSKRYNEVSKERIKDEDVYRNISNSFLYKENLFQVKLNKSMLGITIKQIDNDSLLMTYQLDKKGELEFKNSPFYKNSYVSRLMNSNMDTLSASKPILKNLFQRHLGVAVYQNDDALEMVVGAYTHPLEISSKEFVEYFGTIALHVLGVHVIFTNRMIKKIYNHNSILYGLETYDKALLSYFKTKLDASTFTHLPGKITPNPYDKIVTFLTRKHKELGAKTIIRMGEAYVLGFYDKKDKSYYMWKFE